MKYDYENDVAVREKIAETMMVEIDEFCEASNDRRHSRRLGSSKIGESCSREIWYGFRWAKKDELGSANRPAGRVIRLFNRGHREEPVLIQHLINIGCTMEEPPEGQEQFTFSSCEDHAVTKLDMIGYLPPKFQVVEKVMFEFKTANQNSFNAMKKNGIQVEQPKYWAQVCFSGRLTGLKYVLIVVVCKNDDDIHIEFHRIDEGYGEMLESKAMHIITSKEPPLKISQSATNFACKFCTYKNICHYDEPVEKNCRSCVHATPGAEGKWLCTNPSFLFNGQGYMEIPEEVIHNGCDYHQGID